MSGFFGGGGGGGTPVAFSGVSLKTTSGQGIAGDSSFTYMSWAAVVPNTDYWTDGDPTKVYAPEDGVYFFSFKFNFPDLDNKNVAVGIVVNGNPSHDEAQFLTQRVLQSGWGSNAREICGAVKLTAGDYVQFAAQSNYGFTCDAGSRALFHRIH